MAEAPVQFEVGGRKYATIPITGFDVLDLDRIVTETLYAVHSRVKAHGIGTEDNASVVASIARELTKEFASMSRDDYKKLLELSLSSTTLIGGAKEKDTRLSDADVIGNAFAGHLADIPEVLAAVWTANKLTPFA